MMVCYLSILHALNLQFANLRRAPKGGGNVVNHSTEEKQ